MWASEEPEKLGKKSRSQLVDTRHSLYVSAVSTLEIARLAAHGQLTLSSSVASWCERAKRALGASSVEVNDEIAIDAYSLPGRFHADPADRLLVATARVRGLRLLTADARILAYAGVRAVDARK